MMSTETSNPSLKRDTTMAVTAQEGKEFLAREGNQPDEDAKTRGQQKVFDEVQQEAPKPAKIPRTGTMAATAQEGAQLLGEEKDNIGKTRSKTDKPSPKKSPRLKKVSTMQSTTQSASTLLEGEELGRTRSQTKQKQGIASPPKPSPKKKTPQKRSPKKAAMKREGTMQATAKEGKEFLEREEKSADKGGDSEEQKDNK